MVEAGRLRKLCEIFVYCAIKRFLRDEKTLMLSSSVVVYHSRYKTLWKIRKFNYS